MYFSFNYDIWLLLHVQACHFATVPGLHSLPSYQQAAEEWCSQAYLRYRSAEYRVQYS